MGIKACLRTVYVPEPRVMSKEDRDEIASSIDRMADAAHKLHKELQSPARSMDEALEQLTRGQ